MRSRRDAVLKLPGTERAACRGLRRADAARPSGERQRLELERFEVVRFAVVRFAVVVLVFFGADAVREPSELAFDAADFEVDAFVVALDFVPVELLAPDDFELAAFAFVLVDDFVVVDRLFAVEDELVEREPLERREVERFLPSPIGSALPTAFTAPPATSPTVPATFPAVRPTCFTTLPASGIGCPPLVCPVTGRSSARNATGVPNTRAGSHSPITGRLSHEDLSGPRSPPQTARS
jgi:hypothetical protein